jgi:hypothetical protein
MKDRPQLKQTYDFVSSQLWLNKKILFLYWFIFIYLYIYYCEQSYKNMIKVHDLGFKIIVVVQNSTKISVIIKSLKTRKKDRFSDFFQMEIV